MLLQTLSYIKICLRYFEFGNNTVFLLSTKYYYCSNKSISSKTLSLNVNGQSLCKNCVKKRWNSFLGNVFLLVRLKRGWPPAIIFSKKFRCIISLILFQSQTFIYTRQNRALWCWNDMTQTEHISIYACKWITNIQAEWSR